MPPRNTVKKFKQLFDKHLAQQAAPQQGWPFGPFTSGKLDAGGVPAPGTSPAAQRTMGLMRLFDQLKQRAQLPQAQMLQGRHPEAFVADENYMPAAWADPKHRQVMLNTSSQPAFNNAQGMHAAQQYDKFVAAHELGHLGEAQYLPNKTAVDQYTDMILGTKGRTAYWIKSNAGRSELRRNGSAEFLRPNKNGMPTVGPGTTHSAPNEQYATDFAGALGYGRGSSMKTSGNKKIQQLKKMGRLPK